MDGDASRGRESPEGGMKGQEGGSDEGQWVSDEGSKSGERKSKGGRKFSIDLFVQGMYPTNRDSNLY